MPYTQRTMEEVGRIGEEIYRRDIHPGLPSQHKGKFLVLDINTREYEIDEDDAAATRRLKARIPDAELYGVRIGYTSAYTLGGRMTEE